MIKIINAVLLIIILISLSACNHSIEKAQIGDVLKIKNQTYDRDYYIVIGVDSVKKELNLQSWIRNDRRFKMSVERLVNLDAEILDYPSKAHRHIIMQYIFGLFWEDVNSATILKNKNDPATGDIVVLDNKNNHVPVIQDYFFVRINNRNNGYIGLFQMTNLTSVNEIRHSYDQNEQITGIYRVIKYQTTEHYSVMMKMLFPEKF